MDIDRLDTGHSIYINLAVLQAALRSIIYDQLREPPFGLGANEYATLRYLARTNSAIAIPDVCSYLAISRASARQVVKRLADQGLIASSREPGDRRLRSWRVTAEGASIGSLPMPALPDDLPLIRSLNALSAHDRAILNAELQTLVISMQSCAGEHSPAVAQSVHSEAELQPLTAFPALFEFWLRIARAYRRIRAEQTCYLMQVSGGLVDTAAYMALYRAHEGPINMNGISGFLRVDQNTASRIVDRLVRTALVSRTYNPSSRREMLIAPTDKGTNLLESISGLDQTGDYIKSLARLDRSGASLADLLQRVVSDYSPTPIFNSEIFYDLIRRVFARQTQRQAPEEDQTFRLAMSEFLTGVAIITVKDETSSHGITVTSVSPVSFNPPILLICMKRSSRYLDMLQKTGSFGVSVLSSAQAHIADRFSRWETEGHHPDASDVFEEFSGIPLIRQSLVGIVCDLDHIINDENFALVLGVPQRISLRPNTAASALGYWRNRHVRIAGSPRLGSG